MKIFIDKIYIFLLITFLLLPACASVKPFKKLHIDPPIKQGVQKGIASWYGDKFHGRPTASGETYDMYALSAAHRTLPLGTIVRVKNMRNGKEVDVVVNDRGPFVDGRILDLSFAAARKIDMVEDGVAPIRLEITGRNPYYASYITATKVKNSSDSNFVIQLGSFTDPFNAERLKIVLEWKYNNVYIEETSTTAEIKYYRVRIGPYDDHNKVIKQAKRLAEEGYKVWVTEEE